MTDTLPLQRPLVLVSWDGRSQPLSMMLVDAPAQFDVLLFDYSGRCGLTELSVQGLPCAVLSGRTECKGDIYQALAAHLQASGAQPPYVGLIDDDIVTSVRDLNQVLHVARCHSLDSFSPCLSHDSVYAHRWTLQRGHNQLNWVDWVEVMMPFYRLELFLAAAPHYAGNVSSYGIDKYLMPTMQKLLRMERTALVNTVLASHVRPISSGDKVFRNGMTGVMERARMKAVCMALVDEREPGLKETDWYRRIFLQRHVRTRWQMFKYGLGRPIRAWLEHST